MKEHSSDQQVTTTDDPRWARVVARDPNADSLFWYSVITTGVYCRPSCPSRSAKPEHVRIHDSLADAQATGCRPCRRCNPDGPSGRQANAALVTEACRLLEQSEHDLSLAQLAQSVGRSPSHFLRTFKALVGVTPKVYAAALRAQQTRHELQQAPSITQAMYQGSFSSSSHFYQNSEAILGMTPTAYRSGGVRETLHFAVGTCSLGAILVASSEKGVVCVTLGHDAGLLVTDLQDRFPAATLVGADAGYEQVIAQVVGMVESPGIDSDLPLDIRGTVFQQRVWQALRAIPAGQTMSYAEVARQIGQPTSARAVARACGANAIAVAIPCHRVVRQDGGLSGYRWGIDRKRALLDREAGSTADTPPPGGKPPLTR